MVVVNRQGFIQKKRDKHGRKPQTTFLVKWRGESNTGIIGCFPTLSFPLRYVGKHVSIKVIEVGTPTDISWGERLEPKEEREDENMTTIDIDLNTLDLEGLKAYIALVERTHETKPTPATSPQTVVVKKRKKRISKGNILQRLSNDDKDNIIKPVRDYMETHNEPQINNAFQAVYNRQPQNNDYKLYRDYVTRHKLRAIEPLSTAYILWKSSRASQADATTLDSVWEEAQGRIDVADAILQKRQPKELVQEPNLECLTSDDNKLLRDMVKNMVKDPKNLSIAKPTEGVILNLTIGWADFITEFIQKSGDYARWLGIPNKFKVTLVGSTRKGGRRVVYQ